MLKKIQISYKQKKRLFTAFLLVNVLLSAFVAPAHADYGPKPSVIITTEELPESICYGTLLASKESYARYHAVNEPIGNEKGESYAKAHNAFLEYAAQDDYYFWGRVFEIKDGYFSWSYYPPEQFKVLLYDADTDSVYASGKTERYTFDSIYKARVDPDGQIRLLKASYILKNILNFCIRLIYTVLIEVLIALLFGYRGKKEILLITSVNIITQFGLNLFIGALDRSMPDHVWFALFPLVELIIIIAEAAIYACFLKSHTKKRAVAYAAAANVITLLSGGLIAVLL